MWMRSVSGQTAQDFVSAYPTPRDNLLSCFPLNARFLKRFLILTVTVSAHGTVVQKYRVQIVQVAEMKCLPCGSTLVVLHPSPLHAEVELLRRWLCSESIFCPMFTRNRMRNGLWLQARGMSQRTDSVQTSDMPTDRQPEACTASLSSQSGSEIGYDRGFVVEMWQHPRVQQSATSTTLARRRVPTRLDFGLRSEAERSLGVSRLLAVDGRMHFPPHHPGAGTRPRRQPSEFPTFSCACPTR